MRRLRAIVTAAAIIIVAAPAQSSAPLPTALQVLGTVTTSAHPVANALVIALNLHDFVATQTYTSSDGTFSIPALRAGIYKIIAVKQGFVPAITTVIPTTPKHRVALKLETEKARKNNANQEIWELRGSLPADVLRELDQVMQPVEIVAYEIPRIRGEMSSITGVSNQTASPAFAQTSLGVQGRLNETWQVGIRGNLQRFEDPTDEVRFGPPVAESSVMSMELRSSPTSSYRVASTKSTWRYADGPDGGREADIRAHNFEWQHGASRVQVRYFQQQNLFRDLPVGSNLIEIAGDVPVMQTRRTDLGVAVRVTQETVEASEILRTADVAANGTFALVPSVILHYGMASRIGIDGQEWAPRTGAEWKITDNTSIVGSAMVKVIDRDPSTVDLPSLVFLSEDGRGLPKYTYTFGIISGKDGKNRLSAIATVSAVDTPLRVVFTDAYDQFWDGLYVETGDVRRDMRVAYRHEFGNWFAVDVATTAGTAAQRDAALKNREKTYVVGDLQSTFNPTRTTIAVSYREIEQPRENGEEQYHTERINLRMAQSLYLPIDIKLLLGMELTRADNSPYLIDSLTPEGTSKKYIGGLALNF